MEDKINMLKSQINKQKAYNMELYRSLPVASHEDPKNDKAEPILKQWREGSKKLRELQVELQHIENKKEVKPSLPEAKIFVNSYGEATTRTITSASYEKAEKRIQKRMMSLIGG